MSKKWNSSIYVIEWDDYNNHICVATKQLFPKKIQEILEMGDRTMWNILEVPLFPKLGDELEKMLNSDSPVDCSKINQIEIVLTEDYDFQTLKELLSTIVDLELESKVKFIKKITPTSIIDETSDVWRIYEEGINGMDVDNEW